MTKTRKAYTKKTISWRFIILDIILFKKAQNTIYKIILKRKQEF